MKTLQSNFTTPEQSKRLLELGLPSWTADCYFRLDLYSYKTEMCFTKEDNILHHYTPCWSVGRLIEIAKICSKSRYALRGLFLFLDECEADECMSQVMDYFEICNYQFDFSKLEE